MKIYALLRTRNEAKNLDRFICSYLMAGVDKILIADGGSTDDTASIAKNYWMSGVEVRTYTERVQGQHGLWRNPEGKHISYLQDWAWEDGADWVILQDCDCVPNKLLQTNLRREFEFAECDTLKVIQATLIYMYGQDQYFPELNKPGPSLYAWHKDSGIRFSEVDPWNVDLVSQEPIKRGTYDIPLPMCCLHYFCPDPETMLAKHNFYKNSGQQPSHMLPEESCGPLDTVKDWMRWK